MGNLCIRTNPQIHGFGAPRSLSSLLRWNRENTGWFDGHPTTIASEQFGDNRRSIRCDQFTATRANFLNRLAKATGACLEKFEDVTPLRLFHCSKEMFIVLDNSGLSQP